MKLPISALGAVCALVGVVACGDGGSSTGASSSTSSSSSAAKLKPSGSLAPRSDKPAEKSPAPASAAPGASTSASPASAGDGGTSTTGYDSPDAFGKAMAEAFSDPSKLGSLFPADSVIDASFDCTPPDAFRKLIRESIAEVAKDLKKHPGTYQLVKVEVKSDQVKKLAKGEKADDCTAKADAETTKFRVTLKSEKDEDSGSVEIIQLGGKYYAIGM